MTGERGISLQTIGFRGCAASDQLMSDRHDTNSGSLISSAHLKLIDTWRHRQEAERKRQRLGRIRLPTLWFRLVWIVFFVMRVAVFFFLLALSFGYWFMSSPILENTRNAYNLPGSKLMLAISGFIGFGAAVYAYQLAGMVQFSIKQKRLAFKPRQRTTRHVALQTQRRGPISILRYILFHCRVAYREILGPRGLMGIEHPYFLQFLMMREIVEIASQGYQTYTSSTMVPRRWINNLATAMLVLNCWSTLLVEAFGPKSLTVQRVLCLAIDTVLDFGWTVVIPVCIAFPYIVAYDPKLKAYPDHLLANYEWQLTWQMDIQQLCITSWLDFISSMLPCVSMLTSSRSIARMLDEKRTMIQPERLLPPLSKRVALKQIEAAANVASVGIAQLTALVAPPSSTSRQQMFFSPLLKFFRQTRTSTRISTTSRPSRRHGSWPEINSHFLFFFLLGVGVLCAHFYAAAVATRARADVGCLVPMRPWFTRSYACAYANINCRAGRTGNPSDRTAISDEGEIEERLSAFQPNALRYLVISHCSALKIPATVQRFHNLQMVEVYNSTIIEWPSTATFTSRSHPNLRRFGLTRTNLSTLPDALVQDAPFVFMNLIATNLTTLPDSILSNWKALQYFTMEHGQLREIPRAIAAMEGLERLSVCDNLIEALPESLPGAYSVLNVARNPLRALPRTIRDASRLRTVTFEHTQVADGPTWLADAMAARAKTLSVFGNSSPFCEHVAALPSSPASGVTCSQPSRFVDGYYMLALISQTLASP